MDDARTVADAIVYSEGVIQFVGGEHQARLWLRRAGLDYAEHDARGGCILPGFIDAHLHPMLMAVYEHSIDLKNCASVLDVECLIVEKASQTPEHQWILGLQLDPLAMPAGQLPDRYLLDKICPDNPLVLFGRDGHSVTINTIAMRLASLENGVEEIEGGTIERNTAGEPSGIFRENAVALVMAHFVPPSQEQIFVSAQRAFSKLAAEGVTSIGAILQTDKEGPGGASSEHEFLAMEVLADTSPFAIYSILIGERVPSADGFSASTLNAADQGNKINAFKIFSDGTLGSCTACMHQGFFDHPEKLGYLTLPTDEIYRRMVDAHLQGWQICIHAIGDKAVETCVTLYERLLDRYPRQDHRHRIEHASVVNRECLEKISQLRLVLCCQPLFVRSEQQWLPQRLGPERTPMAYPFKSFMTAGIVVAGSSDAPIESVSVLAAIECCVTRDGFSVEQCISVDQAIAMYTRNAAYAQFEEHEKGSLEVGKRADMVLLDKNPHQVEVTRIGALKVIKTICAGRESYCINEAESGSENTHPSELVE